MKSVIWIVTIGCLVLITTLCRMNGIILGGIPTAALYGGAIDRKNAQKEQEEENLPETGN